jgi:hypothetical protein
MEYKTYREKDCYACEDQPRGWKRLENTHQRSDSGNVKWNTLRPTGLTNSPIAAVIVPENANMTFTVGFNQFDNLIESLSLRDWSKPGICCRSMAIAASGELQVSRLGSSGFEMRSFPVLFLYDSRAAEKICR